MDADLKAKLDALVASWRQRRAKAEGQIEFVRSSAQAAIIQERIGIYRTVATELDQIITPPIGP